MAQRDHAVLVTVFTILASFPRGSSALISCVGVLKWVGLLACDQAPPQAPLDGNPDGIESMLMREAYTDLLGVLLSRLAPHDGCNTRTQVQVLEAVHLLTE